MRKEGWPELLASYIEAAMGKEFTYGSYDCALFCADWIQLATGIDHAKDLRGYDSMLAAYRIIGSFGSMEAMVTQLLGADPMHAAWAQRGDIVLARNPPSLSDVPEALGICIGRSSAFPSVRGLTMLPTIETHAAWKVR